MSPVHERLFPFVHRRPPRLLRPPGVVVVMAACKLWRSPDGCGAAWPRGRRSFSLHPAPSRRADLSSAYPVSGCAAATPSSTCGLEAVTAERQLDIPSYSSGAAQSSSSSPSCRPAAAVMVSNGGSCPIQRLVAAVESNGESQSIRHPMVAQRGVQRKRRCPAATHGRFGVQRQRRSWPIRSPTAAQVRRAARNKTTNRRIYSWWLNRPFCLGQGPAYGVNMGVIVGYVWTAEICDCSLQS